MLRRDDETKMTFLKRFANNLWTLLLVCVFYLIDDYDYDACLL